MLSLNFSYFGGTVCTVGRQVLMVRCSESLLCVCNSCFERYDFVRQIVDVGKENLFVEALSASFLHCLNPDVKCSPCAA